MLVSDCVIWCGSLLYFKCRYALWTVLLSLLTVTVAKPYYGYGGELLDSRSFFQDDESVSVIQVIQGDAYF